MQRLYNINESFARVRDLSTSICAILIASACNIGLTPLVRPDVPALTRPWLTWVEQNYLSTSINLDVQELQLSDRIQNSCG